LKPNPHKFFKFTCDGKYSEKDLNKYSSKIDTTPGLGPKGYCWEWRGNLDVYGYGRFYIHKDGKKKIIKAHRMAYETSTNKLIPDGMCILHKCDNPKCVKSYDHLYIGTLNDNNKDRENKKRGANWCGENHGMAKLTWEIIREIRKLWNTGKYTQKQLAYRYKIGHKAINDIINNKKWIDKNYIKFISKNKKRHKIARNQEDIIRSKYTTREYSYRQLAILFNISPTYVRNIIKKYPEENH
jgi:hypothetical protein